MRISVFTNEDVVLPKPSVDPIPNESSTSSIDTDSNISSLPIPSPSSSPLPSPKALENETPDEAIGVPIPKSNSGWVRSRGSQQYGSPPLLSLSRFLSNSQELEGDSSVLSLSLGEEGEEDDRRDTDVVTSLEQRRNVDITKRNTNRSISDERTSEEEETFESPAREVSKSPRSSENGKRKENGAFLSLLDFPLMRKSQLNSHDPQFEQREGREQCPKIMRRRRRLL